MNYIDSTIMYLGESVDRNFTRWPIIGRYVWPNHFVGNSYEEEVDYLKDWISRRVNWMDVNVMVAESVSGSADNDIVVFPNPCLLYTSPSPRDRTRSRMPSSA